MMVRPEGIVGVQLVPFRMNHDERGVFTEIFREEWGTGICPVQWNCVRSEPNVLRGVHVHRRHNDYLTVACGRVAIGLQDLRSNSPTFGMACIEELSADEMYGVVIPAGVAHGFYFREPSVHLYAVTHYWNNDDELGCRWDDRGLSIPWRPVNPRISRRDASLPPLDQILPLMPRYEETDVLEKASSEH